MEAGAAAVVAARAAGAGASSAASGRSASPCRPVLVGVPACLLPPSSPSSSSSPCPPAEEEARLEAEPRLPPATAVGLPLPLQQWAGSSSCQPREWLLSGHRMTTGILGR